MSGAWTVRDSSGQLLPRFACRSRIEVGRKLVPVHYDAFRLQVSASYRELFDRALQQALDREGWQIVRIKGRKRASCIRNGEGQERASGADVGSIRRGPTASSSLGQLGLT